MQKRYTDLKMFEKQSMVDLYGADLSLINDLIFTQYNKIVNLSGATGLHGIVYLSRAEYIDLSLNDLKNVKTLLLNPNARYVQISGVTGLSGVLNLSHVDSLYCKNINLASVNIRFNPNAKKD